MDGTSLGICIYFLLYLFIYLFILAFKLLFWINLEMPFKKSALLEIKWNHNNNFWWKYP